MKILFIGGTGTISSACTDLALARGHTLFLLNRGHRSPTPPDAIPLTADINGDEAAVRAALADHHFDAVVNFIAFNPAHVERDIRLFADRTRHYVFISTASVYQKPLANYRVTEDTPLANPYWQYSRDKIAAEERLIAQYRSTRFPATIVRPSLTYGHSLVPLAMNAWDKSWTAVDRMLRGQPVIVPGDGTSLWSITNNSDFAKGLLGLLGNLQTFGHAFHITTDEVITWDQAYHMVAWAAGAPEPRIVHIASDFIAAVFPQHEGSLLGDKSHSTVLDNTKIKRFVPDYVATTRFVDGMRRTVDWFNADPARKTIDDAMNRRWDTLIDIYTAARDDAIRRTKA